MARAAPGGGCGCAHVPEPPADRPPCQGTAAAESRWASVGSGTARSAASSSTSQSSPARAAVRARIGTGSRPLISAHRGSSSHGSGCAGGAGRHWSGPRRRRARGCRTAPSSRPDGGPGSGARVPGPCRQPVEAAAAQQVGEHGLGLVVHGVPGRHRRRQRREASGAQPLLEVLTVVHGNGSGLETGPEAGGRGGHGGSLDRRARSEPVVHVDRRGLEAARHGQGQQSQRVRTAGHRAADAPRRGRETAATEQLVGGGRQLAAGERLDPGAGAGAGAVPTPLTRVRGTRRRGSARRPGRGSRRATAATRAHARPS